MSRFNTKASVETPLSRGSTRLASVSVMRLYNKCHHVFTAESTTPKMMRLIIFLSCFPVQMSKHPEIKAHLLEMRNDRRYDAAK